MRYRVGLASLVWLLCMGFVVVLKDFNNLQVEPYADAFRQKYGGGQNRQADSRIVLVGLDDEAMSGGFYNRTNHARVLRNLQSSGARLVFLDIVFDENREPEVDADLCEALIDGPPTVLAGSSITEGADILPPRLAPSLAPALASGNAVIGSIEKAEETGGELRHYFLGVDFNGTVVPSAALASYSLLHLVRPGDIRYGESSIEVPPVKFPVEGHRDETTGVTVYDFDQKFQAPATGPNKQTGAGVYRVVSYRDLLEPSEELSRSLRDRIVVLGENTTSDTDIVNTPVGPMKGFEVHAQCLDRLMHKEFYTEASPAVNLQAAGILIGAISLLALLTWPLRVLMLVGPALIALYTGLNLWLFEAKHFVLDLAVPVLGACAAIACLVLVRVLLNSRFLARFIPLEVTRGILMAKTTAQATYSTVIVTDIRGYTSLSETRTAVQMLELLNEYHSVTVDIYHRYGGNVLTFQGDAQLVVFGYPRKLKDAAGAAVIASVEVMKAIDVLRAKWGITERANFDVGAGICTGLVYIGDIGSHEQANYTVIGETVRTSHKVQSMSTELEGNVLLDEPSYESCVTKPKVTRIPDVQLEGFPEPKTLYRVES